MYWDSYPDSNVAEVLAARRRASVDLGADCDQLAFRPLGALPLVGDPAALDGETVATAISLVTLVARAGVAGAAHLDDPVVELQDVEVFPPGALMSTDLLPRPGSVAATPDSGRQGSAAIAI